jgi:hypothetical protein
MSLVILPVRLRLVSLPKTSLPACTHAILKCVLFPDRFVLRSPPLPWAAAPLLLRY